MFCLTKALVTHGYVDREEPGLRFVLSRKLLTLAQPKGEERSLVQLAWESNQKIAQRNGGDKHPKGLAGKSMVVIPAGLSGR